MPSRRRTVIGQGAFGHYVDPDAHATEVMWRIFGNRLPLTEDAVFLGLWYQLRRRRGSTILRNVGTSKAINGHSYHFSPDVDLLEVTKAGKVYGYELKGQRKAGRSIAPPKFYEGYDQALALLINPRSNPIGLTGSIFDEVWLVHPGVSDDVYAQGLAKRSDNPMAKLVAEFSPVGSMVVTHTGLRIVEKASPNPYLNPDLKAHFLTHLDKFQKFRKYSLKPIQ